MFDIHHLNQAIIKTDASHSYCELNSLAMGLLNNPTQQQILNWLANMPTQIPAQSQKPNYLEAESHQDGAVHFFILTTSAHLPAKKQSSPIGLVVNVIALEYEIILTLQPISLMAMAFGLCRLKPDNQGDIQLICNSSGHIVTANQTLNPNDTKQCSIKFCEQLTRLSTQHKTKAPLKLTPNKTEKPQTQKSNYLTVDNQLFVISDFSLLPIPVFNDCNAYKKDNSQKFYRVILEPISKAIQNINNNNNNDNDNDNDNNNDHYIQALRASKKQAEQAYDAKSRFLSTMSHEIRSPLNAILNMAQLLLNTELTEKQKKYTQIAYTGGQTLMALINDILDFSKIEAGHFTLSMAPLNPNVIIDDLASLFWVRAAQSDIELAISVHPNCNQIFLGDEQRIRQILINLINNAIKFTEKGGVHIDIAPSLNAGLTFTITDTGIGMTQTECKEVFAEFVQAESSENRRFGGTGLGLSIVKQLVDMMAGEITVKSQPQQGSTFTVILPLAIMSETDSRHLDSKNNNDPKNISTNELPITYHLPANLFNNPKIAAFLDCNNPIIEAALAKQLSYWGIDVYYVRDVTRVLIATIETAYFFGEADEFRENATLYHKVADNFLSTKTNIFICLSDIRLAEQIRHSLHRGFTRSLDKPLNPKKIIEALDLSSDDVNKNTSLEKVPHTTILLVEDGETNREVAIALLERHNITADIACNGKEALEKVLIKQYPLILMDLSMPFMDGLEATSHIRAGHSSNKETPIIALTANAFAEDRATCLAAGMNDYISKPIDTAIFDQKILQWLHREANAPSANTQKNTADSPSDGHSKNDHKNDKTNTEQNSMILDAKVLNQLIQDTSATSVGVILGIYFKELDERIPQMELLLAQEMWSNLGDEAHILKSSSASFGAIELSAKAKIIELNVRNNQFDHVRSAMQGIDLIAQKTILQQRKFLSELQNSTS